MADAKEWIKGIAFTVSLGIVFYLLWDNFFSNILGLAGSMVTNSYVGTQSLGILTTLAWVSFVLLYIACVPLYAYISFVKGGQRQKTEPIWLFGAVGSWSVAVPFALLIYIIMAHLIGATHTSFEAIGTMNADDLTTALNISWFLAFGVILAISALPAYCIAKAYGQLGDDNG